MSVTGSDWRVHFNLPDQNGSMVAAGEFSIRDALLARVDALRTGHVATLSTFTFSGSSASAGAAGPILTAIDRALNTGATVRFIADSDVNIHSNFNGVHSLTSLAARPINPLILSRETNTALVMHHKFALFDYGPGQRWVFTGSANYTGGAGTFQWNVALEARNDVLYAAYAAEAAELLAGRFQGHPAKSHAHDKTTFFLTGSWSNGTARFSPPADSSSGGDNPVTDIRAAINGAAAEIVFALNKLTLPVIADALVQAADRGVLIHGSIPLSDAGPGGTSAAIYNQLNNPANYASTNRVHFVTPYSRADGSTLDAGEPDLVHAKYMVIDPWGERPIAILGSPNWTATALSNTNGNDENLLFIPHREISRMFYGQFRRMTGAFPHRSDFWCHFDRFTAAPRLTLWMTDTNIYRVEFATPSAGNPAWSTWIPAVTGHVGHLSFTASPDPSIWFRARREP